ncbi:hypothetical protein [Nonomuraea sp. NPDC050540]|uniref:hypothetical protein n=1 Tax=Nonomuraea sp. NPDC050540 TaxID=3364367 RepID=UPI0037AFDD0C
MACSPATAVSRDVPARVHADGPECPAGWRGYPLLPARSAHEHTVRARDAVRESYRGAAVDLRDEIPPEAIAAVLEAHRAELARLAEGTGAW